MMFHSDHADAMSVIGMMGLRALHERGFRDDSDAMRMIRRACVRHTCKLPPSGTQKRTDTIDSLVGRDRAGISASEVQRWVRASMQKWVEWEHGTVEAYADAVAELEGHETLRRKVRRLQRDTEHELAQARELMLEMEACGYDMGHVLDMQERILKGVT
jgi:hypothetical protein